jgi:hypothetical protein
MTAEGRIVVPESLPGGERLREVLNRMLHPSPAARFQTAREVRQALLATEPAPPQPGRSVVPAGSSRLLPSLLELPPAPRPLVGEAAERFDKLARPMWFVLNANGDPLGGKGLGGVFVSLFMGLVTFGILPAMWIGKAATQRRRLKRYLRDGTPAVAEITSIEGEKDELGVRYGRVRYQFEADGELHRDSDTVTQNVADRWRPGDEIEVVYLPEDDYDSVIISVR